MNHLARILPLILIALSACGGGEGGTPATPPSPSKGVPVDDRDDDRNGVPDRLDAFVSQLPGSDLVRVAATNYYRVVTELGAKAVNGDRLSDAEKLTVFDALSCYHSQAEASGNSLPTDLDTAYLETKASFNRLYALSDALNGTLYTDVFSKESVCK